MLLAVVTCSAALQHDTPSSCSSSPVSSPVSAPTEGVHQPARGKASPASGANAVTVSKCRVDPAADTSQLFADPAAPSSSYAIISDRCPQCISTFNKQLAVRLGIQWCLSTARHPQTDDQIERVNRVIEDVLRHFVSPNITDWDQCLHLGQFGINNAWHETI